MLKTALTRLVRSDALVQGEPVQLSALFTAATHSPLQTRQRARLILTRTRQIAALLSALTLLWIVVDTMVFSPTIWPRLAVARLLASAGFAVVAVTLRHSERLAEARLSLAALLLVPTVFYMCAQLLLAPDAHNSTNLAVATAYELLPFIVVVGLSIFPLTALESLIYIFPILLAPIVTGLLQHQLNPDSDMLGAAWLLLLIAMISMFASMSQLQFMLALTNQALHDPLTGCYNRGSGEQFLALQFNIAQRQKAPLALRLLGWGWNWQKPMPSI